MNNIFKNAKIWIENNIPYGLPRPYKILDISFIKSHYKEFGYRLARQIPIPWQSRAILKDKSIFTVIYENELRVVPESLCGYCGIKILDDEHVVRWTNKNFTIVDDRVQEPRVISDTMPLHIECMRQARIFCPHMKKTTEDEFEYGDFITLKNNGLKDFEEIKNTPTN